MSGHLDVNVPVALWPRLGQLLQCLEEHMISMGFTVWRVPKPPGGHITPWWLKVQLTSAAPTSSVVTFGETIYKGVNSTPHLWLRGKRRHIVSGCNILRHFVRDLLPMPAPSLPPSATQPPPTFAAITTFDGTVYGPEYLSFQAGARLRERPPPEAVDPEGWTFAENIDTGESGWLPPAYVGEI